MSKDQAIKILIQAVEVATKAGAYSLQDAGVIANAVAIVLTPEASASASASSPTEEKPVEEKTAE